MQRDRAAAWGGGQAPRDPSLANEPGDEGPPCPVSPCLGRRCEACAYPKVGVFLVRHQLLIGPSAKLCNGGGVSIPPDVPPLGHACLAQSRVPHHLAWVPDVSAPVGCPQGPWHLRLHRGIQAGDKQGASTCPRDGDRVAKTLPADHRVPRFPPLPLPTHLPSPPCTCLCLGAGRQGGHPGAGAGGRRWRRGDTGWSESKPGICRMSPYPDSLCFPVSISTVLLQPPAGGWQGAPLGRRRARRSLAARLPLARRNLPFPSLARPWGARPRAINRGAGAHRYSSSHLGCAWEMGGR